MLVYQRGNPLSTNPWRFFFFKRVSIRETSRTRLCPRRMDASFSVGSMSSEVHLWMPMLLTTPIFVSQFAVSLLRWDISERSCWVKTSWGGMIVSHQVVDKKKRNETVRNWFRLRFFLEVDSYPMAWQVMWKTGNFRWVSFQLRKLRLLGPPSFSWIIEFDFCVGRAILLRWGCDSGRL